jgi:hypothetical protein
LNFIAEDNNFIAEDNRMNSRASKYVRCVFALAFAALIPITLAAQVKPAATGRAPWDNSGSKWNIFVGYSYLDPNGKIAGTQLGAPGSTYGQINYGAIFSAARYFNRHLGVQIEADEHIQSEDFPIGDNNSSTNSNDNFAGGSAGVIYRLPMARITPFAHALVGSDLGGSPYNVDTWGITMTGGGGLDYNAPLFNHRLAIRIFQADYQFIHATSSEVNAFRLSTGVVVHFGSTGRRQ